MAKSARSAKRRTTTSSKGRGGSSGASRGGSRTSSRRGSGTTGGDAGGVSDRARGIIGLAFDGHGHDAWGIFLVAVGLLGGLGTYIDSAGPVGSAIAALLSAVFGVFDIAAPVALVIVGLWLIKGPRGELDETESTARRASTSRRVVGVAGIAVAVTGIVHVIDDPPSVGDEGFDAYENAGGYLGAALGVPARSLLGQWGATAIFVLLLILGLSLLSGRPIGEAWQLAATRGGPMLAAAGRAVGRFVSDLFRVGDAGGDPDHDDSTEFFDQDAEEPPAPAPARRAPAKRKPKAPTQPEVTVPEMPPAGEQLEIQLEPGDPDSPWKLPPSTMLSRSTAQSVDTTAIKERGAQLEAALAEHGVTTRLAGMVAGPTVTRYELELGVGTKVNHVVNLSKDIAYAMASPDVRIIAPIPGKRAIGVEVPNEKRQIVAVGDILSSPEARKEKSPLGVAVGRDIDGNSVLVDLAKMPHVLIAGQTGAGKSSCINSIMASVLMRATPDDVRMILVDPKRVELTQYNRVPHLLTEVVTNPKKAANALAWAVAEMERRYELLEEVSVRDIAGYNAAFDRGELVPPLGSERTYERLPLILIVVDELADLMMVAARDVEESINRIAAKARAVGVHLVIATQRPSVNVITGVIKANIPARFAFSVASATDSKVIMNQGGAERLVGKGDLLLTDPGSPTPERIQGCWVEEREIAAIVKMWREQSTEVEYLPDVQGDANLEAVAEVGASGPGSGDDDDLMWQAMELVVRSQLGSTSMLQRKLKVGFARAGRLMDLLEENGVVGPSEGSKAREVKMTVEDLEAALAQR